MGGVCERAGICRSESYSRPYWRYPKLLIVITLGAVGAQREACATVFSTEPIPSLKLRLIVGANQPEAIREEGLISVRVLTLDRHMVG